MIINTRLVQMLEFSDKSFKIAIIKMLQHAISNSLKWIKNRNRNYGSKGEVIRKNKLAIIKLKYTKTKINKFSTLYKVL